jgi:hypothetical protein
MNQADLELQKILIAKAAETSNRQFAVFLLASALVSVLQGVFFILEWTWSYYDVVAVTCTGATLFLTWRWLEKCNSRLVVGAVVILSAQFGIFVFKLIDAKLPISPRLLYVAILVLYAATVVSVLLAGARILSPFKAIALSFSCAVAILLSETILDFLPHSPSGKGPRWVGTAEPHPTLGEVYRPYSALKTYYPDNPRGYFKEENNREVKWSLRVAGGNVANLVFPPGDVDAVRVAIEKAQTPVAFDIQLNQPELTVRAKQRYSVRFRGRADGARKIFVGFSKAHDPWTGLGLYKEVELTAQWRDFEAEFEAESDEKNARIHFDVGGSGVSVELSSVGLRSLPREEPIEPNVPPRSYFVSYKFNALGCRGRDYPIPRTAGTVRVLVLGDSFTLGVGVHEGHTFAQRLEAQLNSQNAAQRSAGVYEVINCGVSGYATREERLFYELVGAKYEPDIVLLVMVWNDDMSFTDEIKKGYINQQRGKLESVFSTWARIEDYRNQRPNPDFSGSAEEILRLNRAIRKRGARLAVVIFRTDRGEVWKLLIKQVTKGIEGTGIPVLDLGNALFETQAYNDLIVHAVDEHPNEIAHGIAAREILNFLQSENLFAVREAGHDSKKTSFGSMNN